MTGVPALPAAETSGDDYLTEARVLEAYERCYRDETVKTGTVQVSGFLLRHTFSIRRLYEYRESIIRMLLSLPAGFREDVGGGGSVGHMVLRGDGKMWAADMATIEKLVALAIASHLMEFCSPRETWSRLPQGLPYVRIKITRFGVTVN